MRGGHRGSYRRPYNNGNQYSQGSQGPRGNGMDLDYDAPRRQQQHPLPQAPVQYQQQQQPLQQQQHFQAQQVQQPVQQQQQQPVQPPTHTPTILSIKNLHYNVSPQDLVDAAIHLHGTTLPPLKPLGLPKFEYDNSDRSTGGALWTIADPNDAIRVAHLLNNEMLDGIAISVSVLSAGVPLVNGGRRGEQYHQAAPAANGVQGGVNTSTLRGVQGGQQGFKRGGGGQAGGQKNKLLARLGPPTVISRLGPKKEDLLARLGPKTGGPTILGRLGAKPGTAAVGANKRGGKK